MVTKITHQITIKLNEERFRPLLDHILKQCLVCKTYSEEIGKILFFVMWFTRQPLPELGSKTILQFLLKKTGLSREQFIVGLNKEYNKFVRTGKVPGI
jgi:hypothetical protein